MKRSEHLFTFYARTIAEAAAAKEQYHKERAAYWDAEYKRCMEIVKQTAKIEMKEMHVTGGTRMDMSINYGDPVAYKRMHEAWEKKRIHTEKQEEYATDAHVYGSQSTARNYELDSADVLYYGLGGRVRQGIEE